MINAWVDGSWTCLAPAQLSGLTPGERRRRGVFETIKVLDGALTFWPEHMSRLAAGLKFFALKLPYPVGCLGPAARRLIQEQPGLRLGRLRIMAEGQGTAQCTMVLTPYTPPAATTYRKGWSVQVLSTRRPANARRAQLKSLDYELFASAHQQARANGFDEALLLNARGDVFEASRANIFLVMDHELWTPPLQSGCLDGIQRQKVMAAARSLKIPVKERRIVPAMLPLARGIFMCNSLMGLMPVAAIV